MLGMENKSISAKDYAITVVYRISHSIVKMYMYEEASY